jgi:hypothetical protein
VDMETMTSRFAKADRECVMQHRFWQGILLAIGMTLVASAADAATCGSFTSAPTGEINPGPSINGANPGGTTPLICNGSTTSPSTTGSAVTTIFLGFSASNTDLLSIDAGSTVFDNQTTPKGTTSTVSVTPGSLTLTLKDVTSGNVFNSGVAYTNFPGGPSVYHFADFSFANAAAYDAFAPFDSVTGNLTTAEIATITADGGFSNWTFIGVEDLASNSNDDWNDLIFAIDPAATPIPATLPLFAGGLGALGLLGRRRKRKATSAIAAA